MSRYHGGRWVIGSFLTSQWDLRSGELDIYVSSVIIQVTKR